MKKLLLALTSIILFTSTKAQIKQNSVLIGGQLSYSNTKNSSTETKNRSNAESLSVGKAIRDNKVVGLSLSNSSYYQLNTLLEDTVSSKDRAGTIAVFYRQYKQLLKRLYVYGEGQTYFSFGKRNDTHTISADERSTTGSFGVALSPGFAYDLFKRFQIELGLFRLVDLRYLSAKTKYSDGSKPDNKSTSVSLYSGLSADLLFNTNIGFRFVF